MSNPFYTATGSPGTSTEGSSQIIRSEFAAIEAAFDKLPTLSGSASLPIFVNAAESALEAVSLATARTQLGLGTGSSVTFTNLTLSGTLGVTGVATFTAQPVMSSLTASRAVFTDGSKGLVSNDTTGTGNVVMSASPTFTGTANFAALTASGVVTGSSFTPTTTATNGLGLAGANNPAIYASTTKVIDATTSGANVTGTLGVSGLFTTSNNIRFTGNTSLPAAGTIGVQLATGLSMWPIAGSTYDFLLYDAAGSAGGVMNVPTGTKNPVFPGDVSITGTLGVSGVTTIFGGSSLGLTFRSNQIQTEEYNGADIVSINYRGYLNGTTQFRNFGVYDGKTNPLAFFQGSTGRVGIGNVTPGYTLDVTGTLGVTGAITTAQTIVTGGAYNAGSIYKDAALGLTIAGTTGSGYDLYFLNGVGTTILRNITGTTTLEALGNVSVAGTLGVSGAASNAIGNTASSTTNLILAAGGTGVSSLRIPHGSAPTSPVNGDIWTTTAGLYVRINGATVGPLT